MTRLIIRLVRSELHPGVVVAFNTATGKSVGQVALSKLEHILGHRREVLFEATVDGNGIKLYEEVTGREASDSAQDQNSVEKEHG